MTNYRKGKVELSCIFTIYLTQLIISNTIAWVYLTGGNIFLLLGKLLLSTPDLTQTQCNLTWVWVEVSSRLEPNPHHQPHPLPRVAQNINIFRNSFSTPLLNVIRGMWWDPDTFEPIWSFSYSARSTWQISGPLNKSEKFFRLNDRL